MLLQVRLDNARVEVGLPSVRLRPAMAILASVTSSSGVGQQDGDGAKPRERLAVWAAGLGMQDMHGYAELTTLIHLGGKGVDYRVKRVNQDSLSSNGHATDVARPACSIDSSAGLLWVPST